MGNLQEELEKVGGTKSCKGCGKPLKDPKYTYCFTCNQKHGTGKDGSDAGSSPRLPADYLKDGYFKCIDGKNYIREEVFIRWAEDTSASLRRAKMTSAAIRRFFTKLRAIEYKYKMSHDFERAREGIYAFSRDARYAETRKVTPPLFTQFIEANTAEAKKDAEHFRAFIEHFQSVIAYFKENN